MRNQSQVSAHGIDVARERVLSFVDAARFVGELKGAKRIALQTLHRWCTKGCRGIVLQTVFVGGARCTSKEALQRFFEAVTEVRCGSSAPSAAVAPDRDLGDIDAILRSAGISEVAGEEL